MASKQVLHQFFEAHMWWLASPLANWRDLPFYPALSGRYGLSAFGVLSINESRGILLMGVCLA